MKTFLTTIILLSSCLWATAQDSTESFRALAVRVSKPATQAAKQYAKDANYLLYGMRHRYLLVINKQTHYDLLHLQETRHHETGKLVIRLDSNETVKKSLILDKYLRQEQLKEAKLYKGGSMHSYTFLRAVYNQKTIVELYVPFISYANSRVKHPIPDKLQEYLIKKLIGLRY